MSIWSILKNPGIRTRRVEEGIANSRMEGGAARAMSEELDKLSVDAMWGTFINGMRRPGETVEQFSDRGARVATRDTERAGRAAAGGDDRPSGAQPAGPTFGVAVGV